VEHLDERREVAEEVELIETTRLREDRQKVNQEINVPSKQNQEDRR